VHRLQENEDLASLAHEYLVEWPHLPYRSFFPNDFDAAQSYLGQFKRLEHSTYRPDGSLFVYTAKDMFVGIRYLSAESNNFGMHCARLEPSVFKPKDGYGTLEILQAAEVLGGLLNMLDGPVHLSAIAACDNTFCQQVLQACGFRLADTIAGYHVKLADLPPAAVDGAVRTARAEDVARLAEITATCFSQHSLNINRFNTEPAFSKDSVGRIYAEWFTQAVVEKDEDLVLVYDDGQLSGFMTWRLPPSHESRFGMSLGRAVLSAVDPARHGQGIYRRLLLTGARWMQQQGVKFIEGKMHLSNHAPINSWQRLSPRLAITYNTFHWSSP
jgi:GNAT superfamily N-acetyltransferase